MPNRIIKESTFSSDRIAQLSDFEFRLWVGLITQADDLGRGDARPAIIKGRVFPLRERVTIKDISSALHALAAVGCVSLYEVGGKPYYQFPSWAEHQRVRDAKSKFPAPEDGAELAPRGESPQVAASRGESPQVAALIQSESEYKSESKATRAGARELTALEKAMEDFAMHRKKLKKPMTDRARELTEAKLEKLAPGNDALKIAILNQSIRRGWLDVFELKESYQSTNPTERTPKGDDINRIEKILGISQ